MTRYDGTTADTKWLTGLRGVAALIVVAGHCANRGFHLVPVDMTATAKAGVWIFFMLSSYLLLGRLTREISDGVMPHRILLSYGIKRVLRIMPLYATILIVLGLLHYQSIFDWQAVLNHLLLRDGWEHFWTIPVEMKFYLVLPIIAFALAFSPARLRLPTACGFFLLALLIYLMQAPPRIGPTVLDPRNTFIFFMFGVLIKELESVIAFRHPTIIALIALMVAIGVHPMMIVRYFPTQNAYPFDWYPLSCAGLAVFMLAGLHSRPIKRVLSLEPLLFIGKVSFGIYLIHYFFFYPPFSAADWFGWRAAEVVFVTILAASLSFYAFERYFIALGERIARMVTRSRYVKEADQIS